MTAKQILNLCGEVAVIGRAIADGGRLNPQELEAVRNTALMEIAYQLAVHNEREAECLPLTPPEIAEAYECFDSQRPEGDDSSFLSCNDREQRWWLNQARRRGTT